MIDNPQVGQEVVTWSHNIGGWKLATVISVWTQSGRVEVTMTFPSSAGELHVKAPRNLEECHTLDDALPLLLMEAAGQHPGEENGHT